MAFLIFFALGSGCLFETEYADGSPFNGGGNGGAGGVGGMVGPGGNGGNGGSAGGGDSSTCEPCSMDQDCEAPDHRCVPMSYHGERFPDEESGFCLRIAGPAAGGQMSQFDCSSPYVAVLADRESLSGAEADTYCGVREEMTTCPAVLALEASQACPEQTDDQCPEGGLCRHILVRPNERMWRCTYACDKPRQCAGPGDNPDCPGFCEFGAQL
jgi:hypothetical protein